MRISGHTVASKSNRTCITRTCSRITSPVPCLIAYGSCGAGPAAPRAASSLHDHANLRLHRPPHQPFDLMATEWYQSPAVMPRDRPVSLSSLNSKLAPEHGLEP